MLSNFDVAATIPVKDFAAAQKFYGETLGLQKHKEDPSGILYKSGNSGIFVYPSDNGGTNQGTSCAWEVENIEEVVAELRSKGVVFEQYDSIPGATRDGDIHSIGSTKAAWFKDPSGNILSLDSGM